MSCRTSRSLPGGGRGEGTQAEGGKAGTATWTFVASPTPQGRVSCTSPEHHLEQAQHGHSGPRGTEGTSTVQVHQAAVTGTLRVVGALSTIHLWGQLSPALWRHAKEWEGWGASSRPQGSRKRSHEVVTSRCHPHPAPAPAMLREAEEQEVSTSLSASPFLGLHLPSARGANTPRSHLGLGG